MILLHGLGCGRDWHWGEGGRVVKGDPVDTGDAESGTVVDGVRGAVVGNWDRSGCWCRPGREGGVPSWEPKAYGSSQDEHRSVR